MIVEQNRQIEGDLSCIEYSDADALVRDPIVSVVMSTYNHAPYIAEAIEGVLSQQVGFPVELVIGEDCSPDNTREIVFDYAERHAHMIRVISSEANVGARLNSWRIHWSCRGKYVAFCEGDDYWHDPLKLQKQVTILEAEPDCVLVHTDYDMFYQEKRKRIERFNSQANRRPQTDGSAAERFNRILCNRERIQTPTVCARRDPLDDIVSSDRHVFGESYFPMADTPRWLELARRGTFRYIDESTATFRRVAESASRSKDMSRRAYFTLKAIEMRRYYADKYACISDTRELNRVLQQMGLLGLRMACLADSVDLVRQTRQQVPQLPLSHRISYSCAESGWCRSIYRRVDSWLLPIRRMYRRWRYGIESSI